jgi:(p)ppGpp synthase/HD superfamily hydrolase
MSSLVYKAQVFAIAAHGAVGQVRKYTGEPYVVHPAEVVQILQAAGVFNPHVLAAAWLHDVLEDTQVTEQMLLQVFGPVVLELVGQLTDQSHPAHGNRAERKRIDREHTARACPEARSVKLADLISNTRSIVEHDPAFARVYLKEKAALLEVLRDCSHPALWAQANELLEQSLCKLN